MIKNQFDTKVKSIRTDNDLEFTNTLTTYFFKSKGIIHEKAIHTTTKWHSERKHKYLLETTRALLFQSKLPPKY